MLKFIKKFLIILGISFIVVLVLGTLLYWGFFAPKVEQYLTNTVQTLLEDQLKREVSIDHIRLNFPNPQIVISNVAIARRQKLSEGTLLSAKSLSAKILLRSLFSKHILIDDIVLDSPDVWVEFDEQGQSNLPIFEKDETPKEPSWFDTGKLVNRLYFPHIELIDAKIYFAHKQLPLTVSVERLNTTVALGLGDLRAKGTISLEGGSLAYQDYGPIPTAFSGGIEFQDNSLSLSAISLQAGTSKITLDGTIADMSKPNLDLSVLASLSLDEIDQYANIHQNLTGLVDFNGTVTGQIPDVVAQGHLSCKTGTAWKLSLDNLDTDIRYQNNQIYLSSLGLDLWEGHLAGDGMFALSGTPKYAADVTLKSVNLDYVDTLLDSELQIAGPVSGKVKVQADSFDFDDLIVESSLTLDTVQTYGVDISQGQTEFDIQKRNLSIRSLALDIFQGTLTGTAALKLYSDFSYQANVEVNQLSLESIMAMIPQKTDIAGLLSGTIVAEGSEFDLEHLALQTDLHVEEVDAYGIQTQMVQAKAAVKNRILTIDKIAVPLFGGNIDGKGSLVLAGETLPLFTTQLTFDNLSVQKIMKQFAVNTVSQGVDVDGAIGGTVKLSGASFDVKDIQGNVDLQGRGNLSVAVSAKENTTEDLPFTLALKTALHDNVLDISTLQVDSSTLQLSTTGNLDLKDLALDLDYELASEDLHTLLEQVLVFVPGLDSSSPLHQFAGNIEQLKGRIHGPVAQLEIEADTHFTNADFVWAAADDIRAKVLYQGTTLTIKELQMDYKKASITLDQGTIDLSNASDPQFDLPLIMKSGELADYLAMVKQDLPVAGKINKISTSISGSVSNLQADIDLTIDDLTAWGQGFDALNGKIQLADNRITINSLSVKKNGGTIDLKGFLGFDLSFRAQLAASDLDLHNIDALQSAVAMYQGKADISLDVEGTFDNPQGFAEVLLKDLSYNGNPTEDATCEILLKNQKMNLSLVTFRKSLVASVELSLTPDLLYKAKLSMEQASVEQLLSLAVNIPGITGIITGNITSEGSLSDVQNSSADIKLSELDLDIFGQKITNSKDIDFVVTPQKFTVNSLELKGEELGLFARGFLDFQGNYDLDVDGILDLRPILAFIPKSVGISSLEGRVQLICSVRGTFEEPEIEGVAELNQGSVKLDAYPEPVTNLHGKLAFTKGVIKIVRIEGRLSKGDVATYGTFHYEGITPKDFSIDAEGTQLVINNYLEGLNLTVSPHVRISGNLVQQKLAGEIFIDNVLYSQDIDFQSMIFSKTRDISLPATEAGEKSQPLLLDLAINAPKNVKIQNKLADLDIKASLRIQGSVVQPSLEGRVELSKGKIIFGDIKYNIISGVFDFLDPLKINPEMNIQVETVVQDYDIQLRIDGNLEKFTLNMSSDPPLSDGEIARLLAAGSGNGTNGYNFVTKPLQTLVEGQIEKAVKLDRFSVDVDPLLSDSGDSEAVPTVTLGKRLFKDLLVTFTTTVGGAENSQIVELEYELSDNISLSARRDENGELETSFTFKFKIK